MSDTAPYENPLVPNKKLRQMYTAMVQMQLLDRHIAGPQRRAKTRHRFASTRGQEACRVSTAIELKPGDLISDAQVSVAMDLLFGAKVDSLLRHIVAVTSTKQRIAALPEEATAKLQLPWIDDAEDRLKLTMGATLAFRTLKQTNIAVAYLYQTEISAKSWTHMLELASQLTLPIIFVVLPSPKPNAKVDLCAMARSAGIPGIPVDASDAVALYRVAQESIGRTRAGDGPVLIECIAGLPADDPIIHMRNFLIDRKVCTKAWADNTEDSFLRKIAAHKSLPK